MVKKKNGEIQGKYFYGPLRRGGQGPIYQVLDQPRKPLGQTIAELLSC